MKSAIWRAVGAAWAQQGGRLFLWGPVAFGTGAALYFALPGEPVWWWCAAPCGVLLPMVVAGRHWLAASWLNAMLTLLLLCALGLMIAKLRADHVSAPVLNPDRTTYRLTAFVVDNISPSREEPRLLLAPIRMDGVTAQHTPLRLRVSLRSGVIEAAHVRPGDAISVFAILNPPPSPSLPGGYDFAQAAWFQGVGGVGFAPGTVTEIAAPRVGFKLDCILKLNQLRWWITQRLLGDIRDVWRDDGELGGFAAALVTGQQAFVPQSLINDMRASGLAHILSISGVHMAVVGGFVFFGLRWLMALIPALALRFPIKKIAAGLGVMFVLAYLAISGAPAPAVRSAVVACVAFGAILLDRRALSLRALAIAAFVVIALTPEAVIQPGFLMSFSATAALLALAEGWRGPIREISVPGWVRVIQAAAEVVWLSLMASLVATAATTPFAIAYFNRFSVYGLASNLFESPVTAFIVMPFLAVGTALSATPVGQPLLNVAAGGLWLLRQIAALTAGLPQAVIGWPSAPAAILPLATLGVIWMCLIKGHIRWLGLVLASAILWWPRAPVSDIWIDPAGGNAAMRIGRDAFALRPKVRQYGFQLWTQRYNLSEDANLRDRYFVCKGYACLPKTTSPYRVGFWFSNKPPKPGMFDALCQASDLVVLRNPMADWPASCARVNRISAGDFRRLGAMELTRQLKGWAIKAAQPLRGQRYWSVRSDADADQ
ncbi:MAG TPA: ComEC/Rec2 family competence protein [Asticcacaulis sp.]|nr:ComEC/Rec2 family competence protein [Asticcacaulis sp.]